MNCNITYYVASQKSHLSPEWMSIEKADDILILLWKWCWPGRSTERISETPPIPPPTLGIPRLCFKNYWILEQGHRLGLVPLVDLQFSCVPWIHLKPGSHLLRNPEPQKDGFGLMSSWEYLVVCPEKGCIIKILDISVILTIMVHLCSSRLFFKNEVL